MPRTTTAALAAGILLLGGAATEVAQADGKKVEVTVTDSADTTTEGRLTHYRITVRNEGGKDLRAAVVTQSLAGGAQHVSSSPRGTATDAAVTWTMAIPAGSTREIESVVTPGRPGADRRTGDDAKPGARQQTATTVCVRGRHSGPALGCAGDTDTLTAAPQRGSGLLALLWVVLGTGALAGVVVFVRRRLPVAEVD